MKFWRIAEIEMISKRERAADLSQHFGRKFLHQIIEKNKLNFWTYSLSSSNKQDKQMVATGTDHST